MGQIKEHCFDTAGTNLPKANVLRTEQRTSNYIIHIETNEYDNHVIWLPLSLVCSQQTMQPQ